VDEWTVELHISQASLNSGSYDWIVELDEFGCGDKQIYIGDIPSTQWKYSPIFSINDCGATDIDGNHYETIQIGEQLWMAENLKATHYNNGDEIPTGFVNVDWGELSTGAYEVYDNNPIMLTFTVIYIIGMQ
jgi:hypothetical protein